VAIIWFIFELRCIVHPSVQIKDGTEPHISKQREYNRLQFRLCTGIQTGAAPKVCVDICECSVKVARVDGRKGWRNKTCRSEVDWVIGPKR